MGGAGFKPAPTACEIGRRDVAAHRDAPGEHSGLLEGAGFLLAENAGFGPAGSFQDGEPGAAFAFLLVMNRELFMFHLELLLPGCHRADISPSIHRHNRRSRPAGRWKCTAGARTARFGGADQQDAGSAPPAPGRRASAGPDRTGKRAAGISSLLRRRVGWGILSLTRRSMP